MSIPDFQTLMLPLLTLAGDRKEHILSETLDVLASQFELSEDERRELLASGRQATFDNRVGWARTYLKKAGLVEYSARGRFRITERGLQVLEQHPSQINVKFLDRFPEFVEFRTKKKRPHETEDEEDVELTPEELLESSYKGLRSELAQELLQRVRECNPRFFEKLVVDLLVAMGYGGSRADAGRAVGGSGDGGIDGLIKEDRVGLDAVYIQAKRWKDAVGRPIVQGFAGSLQGEKASKGVLITTSRFSSDARDFAERLDRRIVLIDGEQLSELMIDHGVGVTDVQTYVVKAIDLDYFEGQL
jgi:restriction system protein